MPDYFLSDVHLRHDRPERGRRLARLVDRLGPGDPLTVVGDLVDFWFASRQRRLDPLACPGLRSLRAYHDRGGRLTILGGNHDGRLRDYFAETLRSNWVEDDLRIGSHGLRLHLAHGHRLGGRSMAKAAMEGRTFLRAFGALPTQVARSLEDRLERRNKARRLVDDRRHLEVYRHLADRLAGSVDLVVLGHIHLTLDDRSRSPRLIVLGGWHQQASYLEIAVGGARLVVEVDEAAEHQPAARAARD